ncbi:MAG TPA: hypothetical protein VIW69_02120 [Candidatus Elarobacter sp.]
MFYGAAYAQATHLRSSDALRDYFSKRGYDVLDEAALAAFARPHRRPCAERRRVRDRSPAGGAGRR